MGGENKIPIIDFPSEGIIDIKDERKREILCKQVREACENHGCFLLRCNYEIPRSECEDMLNCMKTLFDLSEETKSKYQNPLPYRSYVAKCGVVPLHESFGLDDASNLHVAQSFTTLMWPQGNPTFCETLKAMSSKMLQLNLTILKMILESYDIGNQYDLHVDKISSVFRMMKYKILDSESGSDHNIEIIGLVAHTDKNFLTILCQNDVQGLEVLTKEGEWVQVVVPNDAFVIIVGDPLKAWSNGRLMAVKHRVVMSGDKERYSYGLFSVPKEGTTIEVANQLVDKDHPLLYRPFNFSDYFSFFMSNISDDALESYAGLN